MSLKENLSNKILNRSSSYNHYKNNNLELNERINDCQERIDCLNQQLDIKTSQNGFLLNQLMKNEEGFIFSVIMPIYNSEMYLKEAIDSIINQDFLFDKVQVILIDDGSTDGSAEICRQYCEKYPNIVYAYQENQGQANARNNGIGIAKGKYLNFLDSDDKLEKDTFKEIYYHFLKFGDEIDVITISRYNFGKVSKPLILSEKYTPNRIVDIEREYDFPQVSISASFIKRDALCGKFNTQLIVSEDSLLLNKTILNKGKFGVIDNVKYLYRKREESNSTIDTKKTKKEYFCLRMNLYFKELINFSIERYGHVPKYIQTVLVYDLRWLFSEKTEIGVLSEQEMETYYGHIYDVLQYVDEDIILAMDFKDSLKNEMIDFKNR